MGRWMRFLRGILRGARLRREGRRQVLVFVIFRQVFWESKGWGRNVREVLRNYAKVSQRHMISSKPPPGTLQHGCHPNSDRPSTQTKTNPHNPTLQPPSIMPLQGQCVCLMILSMPHEQNLLTWRFGVHRRGHGRSCFSSLPEHSAQVPDGMNQRCQTRWMNVCGGEIPWVGFRARKRTRGQG
ncbi:hypothetical protein CPB84DRAFT_961021 [Gymnopilus junonius]|uniref:Uncharacterized protein n=1 Tax=Gymnopilus junonius TaxID=109634 RepID=A0A9P5TNT1_GYMJU|nr:hypothetical protein CPB84DRAFT_961021 [Gymnopilus junonius]